MKNFLFSLVLILASIGLISAQTTTTIFGNVVNAAGQPVAGWPVFEIKPNFDSTYVTTDQSGTFLLPITLAPGQTIVQLGTLDCDLFSFVARTVDISGAIIPIIFTICDSIVQPPHSDCESGFGHQQLNNLDVAFNGYSFSNVDPTATFTYNWNFGDGTTATGISTTHTYPASGFYNVRMIATSAACSDTTEYSVQVLDYGPTKLVRLTGKVTELNGNAIPDWWINAYGVDPLSSTSGYTDQAGNYSFDVLMSDTATQIKVETFDLCTFIARTEVVPVISGFAGWTANADFVICSDSIIIINPPGCQAYINYDQLDSLTFAFGATDWGGNPVVTYNWDFGDGNTSTDPKPTHTYAEAGIYNVSLNGITADTCQVYACEVVCAFPGLGGPIDTFFYGCQAYFWAYPVGIVLDYHTFQFESQSFGQVTKYLWNFGDGTSSTESNPIHVYVNDGNYNVTLTIETADGCESSMTMGVYAGQTPNTNWDCQAMFLPLPIPDSIGIAGSFVFIDMSTAPFGVQTWSWDFGDGTMSTDQIPFHTYATPGVYQVTLTINSDSCVSQMVMQLDTENPLQGGGVVAFLGQNANNSVAVNDPEVLENVQLYPNPATTQAVVTFDSKVTTDYSATVLDYTGRAISAQNGRATVGANVLNINASELVPGLHMLRIQTDAGVQTLKFLKI
jgi:PKD repeat protein